MHQRRTNQSGLRTSGGVHGASPVVLCLVSVVAQSCWFDTSPAKRPTAVESARDDSWTPLTPVQEPERRDAAVATTAPPAVDTSRATPGPDDDAGSIVRDEPAVPKEDAGVARTATATDAGAATMPDAEQPVAPPPDGRCARTDLLRWAVEYLGAMELGDPESLPLHPSARYTENGRELTLGSGLWRRRPATEFARHVLDESRCSSLTEAVFSTLLGRIIFGVRLRYTDGALLEIEAHVVPQNLAYYDPDGIIPIGEDPWIAASVGPPQLSATELGLVATHFVDGAADPQLLPPTAAGCLINQNGVIVVDHCRAVPPEGERFEQVRYPVADVATGIATAIVRRRGYIAMLLFKVDAGLLTKVEIIGGASSLTTGW